MEYKDGVHLELDGKVFIVEVEEGKVKSKEELDGQAVVEALLMVIEDSLRHMVKEEKDEQK